jgi:voltage-gated potassium channel
MTSAPFDALTSRQRRRLVVEATLRSLATVAVLGTLYFVLPLDLHADVATVAEIGVGCAVLVVLIGWQIRTITRSEHPGLRAIEALAFTIPVYVLLFATTYFLMARALSTNFTESLTRTDALYFSVTVFTTVGFGDITAKSEAARLVVTLQMLLDLLLLGLVVRLFLNAIKRGQQRQVAPREE